MLASVPGLRVAARTSCFALKGKNEDLRVIGERLGVRHVLEGSVRKAGTRLRITAQLTDARDGYHGLVGALRSRDDGRLRAPGRAWRRRSRGSCSSRCSRRRRRRAAGRPAQRRGVRAHAQGTRAARPARPRDRRRDACFERAVALDPELVEAQALLGDSYRLISDLRHGAGRGDDHSARAGAGSRARARSGARAGAVHAREHRRRRTTTTSSDRSRSPTVRSRAIRSHVQAMVRARDHPHVSARPRQRIGSPSALRDLERRGSSIR